MPSDFRGFAGLFRDDAALKCALSDASCALAEE
jgi:hypothetical protein